MERSPAAKGGRDVLPLCYLLSLSLYLSLSLSISVSVSTKAQQ